MLLAPWDPTRVNRARNQRRNAGKAASPRRPTVAQGVELPRHLAVIQSGAVLLHNQVVQHCVSDIHTVLPFFALSSPLLPDFLLPIPA